MELVPNITGTGAVVAHNNREISYISLAEAAKSLNERGARPVQPSGQRSHREHSEATKVGAERLPKPAKNGGLQEDARAVGAEGRG